MKLLYYTTEVIGLTHKRYPLLLWIMSSYLRYVDFLNDGEVLLSHVLSGNGTIMAKTNVAIKIMCFNPRHKMWVGV
jgi:hypothetical protein